MNILTASRARANLCRLIDQVAESRDPPLIAGKRSSAVLFSVDDWTALAVSTPHGRATGGLPAGLRTPLVARGGDEKLQCR